MFDFEKSIARWREEMRRTGLRDHAVLDELESHLREDVEALAKGGELPAAAFAQAAGRLGDAARMRTEFAKIQKRRRGPLLTGLAVWCAGAMGLFAVLETHPSRLREDALLLAHTFLLTAASMAAFVAGGLVAWGAGRAWPRASGATSAACDWAALHFLRGSAGLMMAGLAAGLVWVKIHVGSYWVGGIHGAREVATWLAVAGLIAAIATARRLGAARVSFAASLLVSLAWFVPYTFGSSAGYVGLAMFLAINACCLALGIARASAASQG